MRKTAVMSFLVLLLLSASAMAEEIIGKWVGKTPEGFAISYEFKEDNSVIWSVDTKGFPGPITARYSVDFSTNPIQLDMFDYSYGSLKGLKFIGIVEFLSPTKIKIDGLRVKEEGSKTERQKIFTARAIEFSKVE